MSAPLLLGDNARLGNIPNPSSFLTRLEIHGEDALNIYGDRGVGNKVSIYLSSWLDNTYRPVPSAAIQALDNNYSSDLLLCTAPSGSGSSTVEERLRITADGLVGIGTQNPTTKLDVDGTVRAPTLNATTALQVAGVNIDTIYAPKSNPTFTGTLTAPTINASTTSQISMELAPPRCVHQDHGGSVCGMGAT